MDLIDWTTNWYAENCNGDWEHNNGVLIETLDNPGWSIQIDLSDTILSGKKLEEISIDISDSNWYRVSSNGSSFIGAGDQHKLKVLLESFKEFVGSNS